MGLGAAERAEEEADCEAGAKAAAPEARARRAQAVFIFPGILSSRNMYAFALVGGRYVSLVPPSTSRVEGAKVKDRGEEDLNVRY